MGFRGRVLSAGYRCWEDKVLKHCIVYCHQSMTGVRGREREGGGAREKGCVHCGSAGCVH